MQLHTFHDPPDLESAYARLRELGYDERVFDFNFLTHEGAKVEVAPHRARVIVTNTENQTQRIYNAVDGKPWTDAFCDDVQNGVFGGPPRGATTKMGLQPSG
jgi:hypothetical protein